METLPLEILSKGPWEIELAPKVGGRIFSLIHTHGNTRRSVLRPVPKNEPLAEAIQNAGCYPLIPFSNRIENGTFQQGSQSIHLFVHPLGAPHAIHGLGWLGAWSVEERTANSLTLFYDHPGDDWPWPFEARQTFTLDDAGVQFSLAVTSKSSLPMPCGLGFHPYFPRLEGTRLLAPTLQHWICRPDAIPVGIEVAQGRYSFTNNPLLPTGLDDGFSGWSREALLSYPDYQVRMTASADLFHLVVYSPEELPLVCIEPVSHVTNAANLPVQDQAAAGWRTLAPSETWEVWMRLEIVL